MTVRTILAAERRAVRRYTFLLFFALRASRAERERWKALRGYHERQIKRWRERNHAL